MSGSFHFLLLAFAVLVASLSAYAALEVSERMVMQESQHRRLWLSVGAVVLGLGVWATLFLTVAALGLSMPVGFDIRLTVLALLLCLGSAFYLMHLSGLRRPHPSRLAIGGLSIGAAINAAFHMALAAMQLLPALLYQQVLLGLAFATDAWMVLAMAFLFGIPWGLNSPALQAWTVDLADPLFRGRAVATTYIALEAGIGLGALTSGWMHKHLRNSYQINFLLCSLITFAAWVYIRMRRSPAMNY